MPYLTRNTLAGGRKLQTYFNKEVPCHVCHLPHIPSTCRVWFTSLQVNSGHGQCDDVLWSRCYNRAAITRYWFMIVYHSSGGNKCVHVFCVAGAPKMRPSSREPPHWSTHHPAWHIYTLRPYLKSNFQNCPRDFILVSFFIEFHTE